MNHEIHESGETLADIVEPCPYCGKGTAVEHVRYDNCFVVRCLYCGYTSGHIASEHGAIIRHNELCREAAAKREIEKAKPKPDPDWNEICAKCSEGIEPPSCEYFGDPCGCNSPIYQHHPKMQHGNAAALREALAFADRELRMATEDDRYGDDLAYLVGCMRTVATACRAALAKPPRNCDVGSANEQSDRFDAYCANNDCHTKLCPADRMGFVSCEFVWGQMPYTEGGAK